MATQVLEAPTTIYRRRAQVPVYYPGDDFVSFEIGGRFYHWKGDDVQLIGDWLAHPRNKENNDIVEGAALVVVEGWDAYSCAEVVVREMGRKGFVILEGTPAQQQEQKRDARDRWLRNKERDVAQTIAGHERDCAMRLAIGQPLPERTERVDLAYEWRRSHRGQLRYRPELTCDICAFPAATRADLDEHRRDEHPNAPSPVAQVVGIVPPGERLQPVPERARRSAPAPVAEEPPVADDGTAPEPPVEDVALEVPADVEEAFKTTGRGFSKVQAKAAGREMIQRAAKLDVQLSVADQKGLNAGDVEVMNDVAGRLTAATVRAGK